MINFINFGANLKMVYVLTSDLIAFMLPREREK